MSLLPHLYNYPAFQAFIKSPLKFETMINDFRQKNNEEISKDFILAFSDFSYVKVSVADDEEIMKSLEYFQYALRSFETFEMICKINAEFFYNYENGIEDLMSNLRTINDFYKEYYESKGFEIEKRECFTNPYLILLDWSRAEILDLKAILEAIDKRSKIIKLKKQMKGKFEIEHKKLSTLKSKGKLSSLTSPKSGNSQETIVENIEKELKALETIYKISTCQLIHKEFLVFKQQKVHKHEVILRTFSSASVEEFRSIANQVIELENQDLELDLKIKHK